MDKTELEEIRDYLISEKERLEKNGFIPTLDMVINDLEEYLLSKESEGEDAGLDMSAEDSRVETKESSRV